MHQFNQRRRRKRRPTMSPRFGPSSQALELGLLRLSIDMYKELDNKPETKDEKKS